KTYVRVTHLALDLRPGHQGGDGVDDDHVDRATPDQHLGDLQGLLTGVRLRDQEVVHVHAQLPGVPHVQRVLGVDEGGDPSGTLRVRDDVQTEGRLTAGFRPVDLGDPPPGHTPDSDGDIEVDR